MIPASRRTRRAVDGEPSLLRCVQYDTTTMRLFPRRNTKGKRTSATRRTTGRPPWQRLQPLNAASLDRAVSPAASANAWNVCAYGKKARAMLRIAQTRLRGPNATRDEERGEDELALLGFGCDVPRTQHNASCRCPYPARRVLRLTCHM